MRQYLLDKRDRFPEWTSRLRSADMFRAFAWEADHRAFDDPWVNSIAALWQDFACDIVEQTR